MNCRGIQKFFCFSSYAAAATRAPPPESKLKLVLPKNVKLQWTKILPKADPNHAVGTPCPRSSHGVSWIRGSAAETPAAETPASASESASRLIIYGGEHVARTPLDDSDATWACDLNNGQSCQGEWSWRSIGTSNIGNDNGNVNVNIAPPPRIAHAQAVHEKSSSVYIFGGRAGVAMEEKALNDLWKLDCSGEPGTETWSQVMPIPEHENENNHKNRNNNIPEARSFHKMLCVDDSLYVFGGCGDTSGRLNDMHRYDINTNTWHNLGQSQHLRGRGGATFLPLDSGRYLGIIAGFAGEEMNDGHLFDTETNQWADTALTAGDGDDNDDVKNILHGLRPRSVCIGGSFPSEGISIIFGGEVDPSEKGHEGAGGFENDLVLLDESTGEHLMTIPARDLESDSDSNTDSNEASHEYEDDYPETRGWSDGAVVVNEKEGGGGGGGEGGALYVFGGLSGDDNDPRRLGDLWKLQFVSEK